MRLAINGLGRIGRLVLRQALLRPEVELLALNDLMDARTLAHLVRYDSVHGRAPFEVAWEPGFLLAAGRRIPCLQEPDATRLPFGALGATQVLECTGRLLAGRDAAVHLRQGVERVLVAGPCESPDRTVVMGLNHHHLAPQEKLLSLGDAALPCLALLAHVLDDAFGLAQGLCTSVRGYTSDQKILDLPHRDLRMARAAATSMIPAPSPTPAHLGLVVPRLAGRIQGLEVRVPTPDVGIVDLTATLERDADLPGITAAFETAAAGLLAPWLKINRDELVSTDLVGEPAACAFDPFLTRVLSPRMVKVLGWHDHEWAGAARMLELAALLP